MLKELVDNNEAHFADSGGFVSPSGLTYIGALLSLMSSRNDDLHQPMYHPFWACVPGRDFTPDNRAQVI